jgi:hypothetical protein
MKFLPRRWCGGWIPIRATLSSMFLSSMFLFKKPVTVVILKSTLVSAEIGPGRHSGIWCVMSNLIDIVPYSILLRKSDVMGRDSIFGVLSALANKYSRAHGGRDVSCGFQRVQNHCSMAKKTASVVIGSNLTRAGAEGVALPRRRLGRIRQPIVAIEPTHRA